MVMVYTISHNTCISLRGLNSSFLPLIILSNKTYPQRNYIRICRWKKWLGFILNTEKNFLISPFYEWFLQFGSTLLPTNANFGRIIWIMDTNVWLLEPLFVLNIQLFDIYIWLLVMSKSLSGVKKMVSKSRNHVSTASRSFLFFNL